MKYLIGFVTALIVMFVSYYFGVDKFLVGWLACSAYQIAKDIYQSAYKDVKKAS
jgi:hypothetical protein